MNELLQIGIFPVVLTLAAYRICQLIQKKIPLFSPILGGAALVLLVLWLTKLPISQYKQGTNLIYWLMTPATVSLAIPMYEHFKTLRRNFPVILVSVITGLAVCVGMILLFGLVCRYDAALTISLLPKSVTTAIGVPLSELSGGLPSVTTAVIALTGNLAAIIGPVLCKWLKLTDPVAQGVAFGTSGHVVGTTKAAELGDLQAAAGSLSLITAGILTAVFFPLLAKLAGG